MNRKLCTLIAAGLIVGVSLFLVGCEMCCNSSKGSGSMIITDPLTGETRKATFSYRVQCVGSYEDPEVNPNAVRKISGRLEYQDHGLWKNADGKKLSVSIHGSVDNVVDTVVVADEVAAAIMAGETYAGPASGVDLLALAGKQDAEFCSKLKPNLAMFKGKYRPQPEAGREGGDFYITVEDNGTPGPSPEDSFKIELKGGVFNGYVQSGFLKGGNLKAL